ncbi:MAG: hypothetical protein LUQ65_15020 [Candidatus Helarchaeota archaeon]|nr:hypothetical protein [Candidatus Helarchaeota archaeon]
MSNDNSRKSEWSEKKEDKEPQDNGVKNILESYQVTVAQGTKIEDLDLINLFFHPLRVKLSEGRYDYEVVKAVYSATKLLDTKIQNLLDSVLQKKGPEKLESWTSSEEQLFHILHMTKPIQPVPRPLSLTDIKRAYVELMVNRKKKRVYNLESKKMKFDPVELERISINSDKTELLDKIRELGKIHVDLAALLKVRTWAEVTKILNVLLHLAHEGKIKLFQEDFPVGPIIISYRGDAT